MANNHPPGPSLFGNASAPLAVQRQNNVGSEPHIPRALYTLYRNVYAPCMYICFAVRAPILSYVHLTWSLLESFSRHVGNPQLQMVNEMPPQHRAPQFVKVTAIVLIVSIILGNSLGVICLVVGLICACIVRVTIIPFLSLQNSRIQEFRIHSELLIIMKYITMKSSCM